MAPNEAVLGELLGEGSFGKVFQGEWKGRPLAVKVINMKNATHKERETVIIRELNFFTKLSHPNLVKYKEVVMANTNANSELHIYMELCGGGDLHDAIQAKKASNEVFTEGRILYYCNDTAQALQYLESNNVMHGDLKPKNILLHRGCIKVGDFGLIKYLDQRKDHSASVLGTPIYTAPENLIHGHCNHKGDMWSLGCILFELTTLEAPFKTEADVKNFNKSEFNQKSLPNGYSSVKRLINTLIQLSSNKRAKAFKVLDMIQREIGVQRNQVEQQRTYTN